MKENEEQIGGLALPCHCSCGKSKFTISSLPVLRFCCHCRICQSVYKKDYSDFVILSAKSAELPKLNGIQFRKYKLPPAVNRGLCPSCNLPVIGYLNLIPGLPLAMVPTSNLPETLAPPTVRAHIFYDRRVTDVSDDVPKFSGYLRSEWAVFKAILSALR